MPKTVLFYRRYLGFSGGHLKIADYLEYVRRNPAYKAEVFVDPCSLPDHLWKADPALVEAYAPEKADILFVAGRDWDVVPEKLEHRVPVLNLIQGLRHANPEDSRYRSLSRKAVRICVSAQVSDALQETGRCNGEMHILPAAIDINYVEPQQSHETDVLIVGLKAPDLAIELGRLMQEQDIRTIVQTKQIARAELLALMAKSHITVTLPMQEEGFYLPALEAMAAGSLVVCPDAVGNRGFCVDGYSCLMPARNPIALCDAVQHLRRDRNLQNILLAGAKEAVARHSASAERRAFTRILNGISPRNILLTGLPRSGTTLACNLLNEVPNVVALHEPMKPMQIGSMDEKQFAKNLVSFFDEQRELIIKTSRASGKSINGRVPRNPLGDEVVEGQRRHLINSDVTSVDNITTDRFDLCVKHPAMFTARLPEIVEFFDCFAFVRNPLSVLLSWRNSGMSVMQGRSFAAEAHDPVLAEDLSRLDDVLDRQFHLLDYMFGRYRDYIPTRTIRYEDVIKSGGAALSDIVAAAGSLREGLSLRNGRMLEADPDARKIARRLVDSDIACWSFYSPQDVISLFDDF